MGGGLRVTLAAIARCAIALGLALLLRPVTAKAAESPARGGVIRIATVADPDTFDCHASTSLGTIQHLAPHYSTLLTVSPENGQIVGDLAQSWSVASDQLAYTLKVPDSAKFHDGSALTASDVKATYERLRNPPQGVPGPRKTLFQSIASIEAPDPATVVFHLKERDASFLATLANPWNCIYSAAKLRSDPSYPARTVMGSGPFKFSAFVPGSEWKGERFEAYFKPGQPYLDGFVAYPMGATATVNGLLGGQIDADLRGFAAPDAEKLLAAEPKRFAIEKTSGLSIYLIAFNTEVAPFNDARVRKALALAIDRNAASDVLSKMVTAHDVGGLIWPGSPFAAKGADLAKLPGFSSEIEKSRAEAMRLLKDAGQADLKFKFLTFAPGEQPYQSLAVFLIDQWRQIGVQVEAAHNVNPAFFAKVAAGDFQVAFDVITYAVDDPATELAKFLSRDVSPGNNARYIDRQIDDMYGRLKTASDESEQRRLVRAIEQRIIGDQAYYTTVLWQERNVVIPSNVKGFKPMPSQMLNLSLGNIWMTKR
jgi:peptide/nickel transport system substrate-binding protein